MDMDLLMARVRNFDEEYNAMSPDSPDLNVQLYFAVKSNDLAKVPILIKKGANVNHVTPKRYSILGVAVKSNNSPMVFTLLVTHQILSNRLPHVPRCEVSDQRNGSLNSICLNHKSDQSGNIIQDSKISRFDSSTSSRNKFSPYSLVALASLKLRSLLEGVQFVDKSLSPIDENIKYSTVKFKEGAKLEVKNLLNICDDDCINNLDFLVPERVISCKDHQWLIIRMEEERTKKDDVNVACSTSKPPNCGFDGLTEPKEATMCGLKKEVSVPIDFCYCNTLQGVGYSPLHDACEVGNMECAALLLTAGASCDSLNSMGQSPLHVAAKKNHLEVVKLLLKFGADPNLQSSGHPHFGHKYTALHYAAENGNRSMCLKLLSYGANINSFSSQRVTPFAYAVKSPCNDTVSLLIKFGADINSDSPNAPEKYGRNLLGAVKTRRTDRAEILLANGAIMNPDLYILHEAAKFGSHHMVKLLLQHLNHDIDMLDNRYHTALHYACEKQNYLSAQLLLDKGANPNGKYPNKPLHSTFSPLAIDRKENFLKLFKLLFERGLRLNREACLNSLIEAITSKQALLVEMLLLHGAFSDLDNFEYRKLVNSAILIQTPHIVKLFVMTGLEGYIPNKKKSDNPNSMESLVHALSSKPRTLKEKCRIVIRRRLRAEVIEKTALLSLPPLLHSYLLMQDFDLLPQQPVARNEQFRNHRFW